MGDFFKNAGSGLVSGGLGLISGLISGAQQRKMLNKQIEAQAEENQKTRDYNLMLARQQNAWNIEQYEREQRDYLDNWNRQNEYDSPSAQMERFKAAGLNPNLIYGQMSSSPSIDTSSIAGSLTAGESASPNDMSPLGRMPTFGDALQQGLDAGLKEAQIESIKANTEKVKADTKGVQSDNRVKIGTEGVRIALQKGELELQNFKIKDFKFKTDNLNDLQAKWLKTQINKCQTEAEYCSKQFDLLKQQIIGQELQNAILDIEKSFKRPLMQASINNLSAEYHLKKAETRQILQLLPYKILGMNQDWQYTAISNNMLDKTFRYMKYVDDHLVFDYWFKTLSGGIGALSKFAEVGIKAVKTK